MFIFLYRFCSNSLYSVVFLMMHIPPFLRILLHHLPDSGYARCQYIYFLFGFLTMIFHSVRRVGFHLYMAVSTLQLTSIRNLSEYWQLLLKHTSRCRSIFGFHILLSDTAVESCVTFKPREAPIQLIQFSRFNNQKFCKYTFLYLFRLNAIISSVTANVNSTSCVFRFFFVLFFIEFPPTRVIIWTNSYSLLDFTIFTGCLSGLMQR